jgi:hypothetical protein
MGSGTMASTEVLYHRAVQATTQQEADAAFGVCVRKCERLGRSTADATRIVRDTLGYFAAAYCDEETSARVYQLYKTENPLDRFDRERVRRDQSRPPGASS